MEIKLNAKIESMLPATGTPKPREVRVAKDGTAFEQTEALNKAMEATSDVRGEKVDLGKKLISNVNYPPPEIIRRIANLLAMNVDAEA